MFRMLKLEPPPQGWRAVFWELGIVTIGVLMALGAQQLVEASNWRVEVAGLREAVRAEMNLNLGTYPYRARQKRCITKRLDDLQLWLDSWRAGRPMRLANPIGIPVSIVIRTSAWEGRDPATLSHMPRDEKLEYGNLYAEFANNEVHRLDERTAWIELASYDGATELDHQDMIRLQGLIKRARLRDQRIDGNYGRFIKRAEAIGLKPTTDPTVPPLELVLCRPIIAAGR